MIMKQRQRENGVSMIEVMASLVMVGLVVSGIGPGFLTHIKYNNEAEIRSGAYNAAQAILDDLRLIDPAFLPTSGSDDPVGINYGNRTYSVVASYCEEPTYCDGGSNPLRFISLDVSYQGDVVYEVDTIYTQLR